MNDKPLPINQGAPVRVIVPGVAGARSVKWLDRITVQEEESQNHYQRQDYKILPPEVTNKDEAKKYWDLVPAIQDMPVNSVIGSPETGDTIKLAPDGTTKVQGYALPQGSDGPIVRVDVSSDAGESWQAASLLKNEESQGKWCWVLWQATVGVSPGIGRMILSRATDSGGNIQEKSPVWNLRGVGYNGYGESRDLTVESS
jgi:sulfite oxidase